MDNFHIDITSEGRKHFDIALGLAFKGSPGSKVASYYVDEKKGLVLRWSKEHDKRAVPFPYEMALEDAQAFVWGWLQKEAYGSEPDHDGDNGKGFRIYNESWAFVGDDHYAFVAIQPAWAMYGK